MAFDSWILTGCCDPSDQIILGIPEQDNPNVYVFYDATSLDATDAADASESIRSWFDTNSSQLGDLYEGVIGQPSNNGENWLWWATYPYLGSLTGGTLSDSTQISEFDDFVSGSSYDSRWCQTSGPGTECKPKTVEFNDSSTTYRRINRGYDLSTGNPDPRSQGVPFDHADLNTNDRSGPGSFSGQDTNFIVVLVVDEADGTVGLYHGTVDSLTPSQPSPGQNPDKDDLFNDPFRLKGNGYSSPYNLQEPTNRYTYDYESYLKVWEDIKLSGGSVNNLIYPVCENQWSKVPFVQHSVATVEGTTITASQYLTKYGQDITNVGPENLNLSALTHTNVYSGLTGTTAYSNLNPANQNGAGLKHFNFTVDPKVSAFTQSVVAESLDEFLTGLSLENGWGVNYTGTCYSFSQETVDPYVDTVPFSAVTQDICDDPTCCVGVSPTPSITPTMTVTPSITPSITPSSTPANVSVTGSSTFNMFNQSFDCNTVAKLKDCDSSNYYYVSDSLSYSGTVITTGDTFSAKINTPDGAKYLCLLYESDDSGSSNSYIETIYGISSDCGSCTPPVPSPTPSPSLTPSPSQTPTPTPTPSNSPTSLYVYSACTGTNRVISQNVGVPSVSVGQSFNYNNECWTFVGLFNSPYSPPAGFIYTTSTTNFFGTPSTVYNDCNSCVSAPTPYVEHTIQWAWTYDCPVCNLVGTPTTVYTTTSYPSLGNGAVIYTNTSLTNFFSPGRYVSDGIDVYSVGSNGVLTLECSVGNGC